MGEEAREAVWKAFGKTRRQCHMQGVLQYVKPKVDGVYSQDRFGRRWEWDANYRWQVNTRISYYRVNQYLYLFLVDPPFYPEEQTDPMLPPPRLSLMLPHAWNRGGLALQQLFEKQYFSSFECLTSYFGYGIHLNWETVDAAIDMVDFSYFFASRLWLTNMHWLDETIKEIAFKDIRRPTIQINDRLHDRRQDLDHLKSEIHMTKTWVKPEVLAHLEALRSKYSPLPQDAAKQILEEAINLDRFLMDTFQLLMSSISVLDSQTSIQQAKRAAHLTQLATIYVPLSFVCGLFGMNVTEIVPGSPLSLWVFVVVVVITLGLTGVLLFATKQSEADCREGVKTWPKVEIRRMSTFSKPGKGKEEV